MRLLADRTLLVFAVLGPPIGLASFRLMDIAWAIKRQVLTSKTFFEGVALTLFPGLVASYIIGLLPAVVSGALVAWIRDQRSRYEPLWVAAISSLVGLTYAFCWYMLLALPFSDESHNRFVQYELMRLTLTCIASSLVCWAIVRRKDKSERIPA